MEMNNFYQLKNLINYIEDFDKEDYISWYDSLYDNYKYKSNNKKAQLETVGVIPPPVISYSKELKAIIDSETEKEIEEIIKNKYQREVTFLFYEKIGSGEYQEEKTKAEARFQEKFEKRKKKILITKKFLQENSDQVGLTRFFKKNFDFFKDNHSFVISMGLNDNLNKKQLAEISNENLTYIIQHRESLSKNLVEALFERDEETIIKTISFNNIPEETIMREMYRVSPRIILEKSERIAKIFLSEISHLMAKERKLSPVEILNILKNYNIPIESISKFKIEKEVILSERASGEEFERIFSWWFILNLKPYIEDLFLTTEYNEIKTVKEKFSSSKKFIESIINLNSTRTGYGSAIPWTEVFSLIFKNCTHEEIEENIKEIGKVVFMEDRSGDYIKILSTEYKEKLNLLEEYIVNSLKSPKTQYQFEATKKLVCFISTERLIEENVSITDPSVLLRTNIEYLQFMAKEEPRAVEAVKEMLQYLCNDLKVENEELSSKLLLLELTI